MELWLCYNLFTDMLYLFVDKGGMLEMGRSLSQEAGPVSNALSEALIDSLNPYS